MESEKGEKLQRATFVKGKKKARESNLAEVGRIQEERLKKMGFAQVKTSWDNAKTLASIWCSLYDHFVTTHLFLFLLIIVLLPWLFERVSYLPF